MANIVLLANLNCDRILQLDLCLNTGGRFHYDDKGRRLGGGGPNTGLGLVWAGHRVSLVSQIGRDEIGDWLLAEAKAQGLNCHFVNRCPGNTSEVMLMMSPDGERTIIRPTRPQFELSTMPDWHNCDAFYINSGAQGAVSWAQAALPHCLVVAQVSKDSNVLPCHILLASESDLAGRNLECWWQHAQQVAGEALQGFIVTHGVNGASLYTEHGMIKVSAQTSQLVDDTGAGDAYAGGLLHGLLKQQSLPEAMQEAARWGAMAVATDSSVPGNLLKHYLS